MMLPSLPSLASLAQLNQPVGVAACADGLIKLPLLPVYTSAGLWDQTRGSSSAAAAVRITRPHAKEGPCWTAARGNNAEPEASHPDDGHAEAETKLAGEAASYTEPRLVRATILLSQPPTLGTALGMYCAAHRLP
jgi:hypothetical protein